MELIELAATNPTPDDVERWLDVQLLCAVEREMLIRARGCPEHLAEAITRAVRRHAGLDVEAAGRGFGEWLDRLVFHGHDDLRRIYRTELE